MRILSRVHVRGRVADLHWFEDGRVHGPAALLRRLDLENGRIEDPVEFLNQVHRQFGSEVRTSVVDHLDDARAG